MNWDTIKFDPAPPGWWLIFIPDGRGGAQRATMPGWLTQRNEDGEIRVIAANVDIDGVLVPANENPFLWYVDGPDSPLPADAEVAEEVARRSQAWHAA